MISRIKDVEDIKRNTTMELLILYKESFSSSQTNRKLTKISALNAKINFLKKSFIHCFSEDK